MGRYLILFGLLLAGFTQAGEQLLAHAKSKNLKITVNYLDQQLCSNPSIHFQPIDSTGKPVSLTSVVKYLPKLMPRLLKKCPRLGSVVWKVIQPGRSYQHGGTATRNNQWQPYHHQPLVLKAKIDQAIEGNIHYRRFQSLTLEERKALQLTQDAQINSTPKKGAYLIYVATGREDVWELPDSSGILIHYGHVETDKWYLFHGIAQLDPSFQDLEGNPYRLYTQGKLTGCASPACDQVFSPLEMTRRHTGDTGWSKEKYEEAKALARSSLVLLNRERK